MNLEDMKRRKDELGYSCEQIARLSGVPLSTVQKIFSGITMRPRFDTLKALETVLGRSGLSDWGGNDREEANCVRETEFHYDACGNGKQSRQKQQGEYSLDDYYALSGEQRAELLNGRIYLLAAPSVVHQAIVLELAAALKDHIRKKGGECFTGVAPLDVHLIPGDENNLLEPDVFVVCDREKITPQRIEGAPDLVIEVLSSSTRKRDMGMKYALYLESGVREYWIVDPDSRKVVVYKMEKAELPIIYTFEEEVPVSTFDEECRIDFSEIAERLSF